MFPRFVCLLGICVFYGQLCAQVSDVRAHTVYADVVAVGGLAVGTINYDVRFEDRTHGLGVRLGVGILSGSGKTLAFPLAINAIFGEAGHTFEAAMGVTLFSRTGSKIGTAWVPSASYRYQPFQSGLMLRASLSPFISSGGLLMGGGISMGYRL